MRPRICQPGCSGTNGSTVQGNVRDANARGSGRMTNWVRWEQTTERGVTFARGFRAAAVRCGLKTEGDDLALVVCDGTATAAGVFTTNRVKASCVTHSRRVAKMGIARAIVCNAGNANACNGAQGIRDTEEMAALAAPANGNR